MTTTVEETIKFTLDFKPLHRYTVFDAEAYNKLVEEQLPWSKELPRGEVNNPPKNAIKLGEFSLFNAVFPKFSMRSTFLFSNPKLHRNWLDIVGGSDKKVGFSGDVLLPILQDTDGRAWMSLTPSEMVTQRSQIRRTSGKTIIAGMGMGWFAAQVLQRKKVTEVVIVDDNKDVLDFFGSRLKAIYDKPITLVHTSAYDFDWQQSFNVAVWDIWRAFDYAAFDKKYLKIKDDIEKAGKVCTQWGTMRRD